MCTSCGEETPTPKKITFESVRYVVAALPQRVVIVSGRMKIKTMAVTCRT